MGKTNYNADALSRKPVENNILVMQTRSKAGKIDIPNGSLEVLQENGNEPGELVSNHKEIESSYPDIIIFENENETLEQLNEKLLNIYQNNLIINNKINAQMNDQSQIGGQISTK